MSFTEIFIYYGIPSNLIIASCRKTHKTLIQNFGFQLIPNCLFKYIFEHIQQLQRTGLVYISSTAIFHPNIQSNRKRHNSE